MASLLVFGCLCHLGQASQSWFGQRVATFLQRLEQQNLTSLVSELEQPITAQESATPALIQTHQFQAAEASRIGLEKLVQRGRPVGKRHWNCHQVLRKTPAHMLLSRNVGILIPFREQSGHEREDELNMLLATLLPHARNLSATTQFRVFIAEQSDKGNFNRGKLMNVAFDRAAQYFGDKPFSVIATDCDFVPDRKMIKWYNLVGTSPLHLANDYYCNGFGGVTVFTSGQFKAINGYTNNFWGWGGEDDDAMDRWMSHRGRRVIAPAQKERFLDVGKRLQTKEFRDKTNYKMTLRQWKEDDVLQNWVFNGLSDLEYTVRETKQSNDTLIEHFVVDLF